MLINLLGGLKIYFFLATGTVLRELYKMVVNYLWSRLCFYFENGFLWQRCTLIGPGMYNAKSIPPLRTTQHSQPEGFIHPKDLKYATLGDFRDTTRLRIFSGTANPSLAQVS
jgi:hypothetical protein